MSWCPLWGNVYKNRQPNSLSFIFSKNGGYRYRELYGAHFHYGFSEDYLVYCQWNTFTKLLSVLGLLVLLLWNQRFCVIKIKYRFKLTFRGHSFKSQNTFDDSGGPPISKLTEWSLFSLTSCLQYCSFTELFLCEI